MAMVGALMSTAGLILSTLTSSIDVFIILYGAVSGRFKFVPNHRTYFT